MPTATTDELPIPPTTELLSDPSVVPPIPASDTLRRGVAHLNQQPQVIVEEP
eukprot:CAMPEP_0115167318 /NCGR_PEP_ID=MMETSP0270-20121206/153_1 /TAXON_ID=71861 /ORGANISM="Scrippsiella trochoidea, Strain CCMP3099" /LENGTH=51 /DNA_ID=CAMNT_0002579905 /DNA_START=584 /DNA_END=739 /DNA_ORIENTATION=+